MKVRDGFVSNSSSSSFFIYGFTSRSKCDLLERLEKAGVECGEDEDLYEALEKAFEDSDLYVDSYYAYDDQYYIGVGWSQMSDDETKKQFKERVEKALKAKFGDDIKIDSYSEEYSC